MTANDYIRRIEHGFTACEFSPNNPFRAIIAERLSQAGGLHRSPGVETDRHVMRDEDAVSLMRDFPEAVTGPGVAF